MFRIPIASSLLLIAIAAGTACNGHIGDVPSARCAEVSEQPLRRLSSEQYHNVVRALFPGELGATLVTMSQFPETQYAGFVNDAAANTVSSNEAERIADNAELFAGYLLDNAAARLPEIMRCAPAGYDDDDITGCMDAFIADFGRRVYRRPLAAAEAALARRVFDEIHAAQGAEAGWAATMQFFLQSPALLYRVERGVGAVAGRPEVIELSSWEMASRLSFFFLNSMPDDELMRAAEAGELATVEQIEAQARRLVDDPAVYAAIDVFHRDWLRTGDLADVARDDPAFEGARDRMIEETGQLVRWVLEESDGRFETLLTTSTIPVAPELRDIYGAPAGDVPWEPLALPERHGLLTLASVNAVRATADRSHPIKRGVFLLEQVLCASVPAFPGNVDIAGPLESTADLPTARQRLQPLIERDDCRGCHTTINPPGFALENFDAVGRYRTAENGVVIDASGELRLDGVTASFAGPADLIDQIAASEQARNCYATQLFRFAAGKTEAAEDQCSLDVVQEAFTASGGDLREALVAITTTDAFRYRSRGEQ
jgi:uncharacterized protein DUF1592/uncharacterized protein DUF1588/uncharacterized protein DUF1585/uncharacterized protein DUF1595/uncharacterized protein DUF1587